jgi:superoxide reductase
VTSCKSRKEKGYAMDRRDFLKSAVVGSLATGIAAEAFAAKKYFPVGVDEGLFQDINRVKDPSKKTALEKKHGPVIKAPDRVKAGEPFTVEISVGEELHPMGPSHWIEFIALDIGNEPAGRIDFQSYGYLKPRATFTAVLTREAAPSGRVTLVAHQRCNLHGYWEGVKDIEVS